ncbi:hypothetical protein ES703_114772 [subsurface metagenome]
MNETGSNKLYIDNSGALADDALIYGDFELDYLSFDADVNITWDLNVEGNIAAVGTISPSDVRWKKNVNTYENALDKVMELRGVTFEWKTELDMKRTFPDKPQIGVIAQEIESVIPEVVKTNDEGYKLVDYSKLTVVLIEAMKEQQRMIEELQKENRELLQLKSEIEELKKGLGLASKEE